MMFTKTPREKLRDSGLVIWHNKKLDQMTDEECKQCLQELQTKTGIYYVG